MKRLLIGAYLFISILLNTASLHAQTTTGVPGKILNLDSLSPEDRDLLLQYQDSFKNDLYEVLDLFNTEKRVKQDTAVYDMDRRSHVEITLDFISRILINGRIVQLSTTKGKAISLSGVGFCPVFGYYHKTGLYFKLNTAFYTDNIIARASPVPVISPSAGYTHTLFKRWYLGADYARTFVTYGSSTSRNLLNNNISISSSVDIWKKFIFTSTLYFYWSGDHSSSLSADEKTSVSLLVSLRKEFRIYKFLGANEFTITPALNFYFADDNRTYITALGVSDVKKDNRKDTITRTQNVNDFFGFLDLEPAISFDWRIRNLNINFMPVLAVPFNIFYPAKDTRTLNPKVCRFYAQASIKYLFCVKPRIKKLQPVSGLGKKPG